ncbi:MAG: hypothetical protein JSS07_00130, partial [Proteobacteria bacterium]|nr:hypothetical protein [Pseudomonadota bacterium]
AKAEQEAAEKAKKDAADKKDQNKKSNRIRLAAAFVATSILFSLVIAFSPALTLITDLLLKLGITLSPTNPLTVVGISATAGQFATLLLSGITYAGMQLKVVYDRYKKDPEERYKMDIEACNKSLLEVTKKFETSTGETFIVELENLGEDVPDARFTAEHKKEANQPKFNKLDFKQFELSMLKEVAESKDDVRNQVKADVLAKTKAKFSLN